MTIFHAEISAVASLFNLIKMQNYQIAIKELFPIVLSLEIWGDHLKNGKIMFYSDNMAVVEIINKQTCKDAEISALASLFNLIL
jgi:hypothetical protein